MCRESLPRSNENGQLACHRLVRVMHQAQNKKSSLSFLKNLEKVMDEPATPEILRTVITSVVSFGFDAHKHFVFFIVDIPFRCRFAAAEIAQGHVPVSPCHGSDRQENIEQ